MEKWLKEKHNGFSKSVLRGDWKGISADISRSCNWTAAEDSESPRRASYSISDRAIDRLEVLTKQTGRVWYPEDFQKGNVGREEKAREQIRLALVQLIEDGRRVTVRGLERASGCDRKTIRRHADIWGVFRLSNGGGDLSFGGVALEPPDQFCSVAVFDDVVSGNALCADFSMELDSLRLNLSGATANNSTATTPEVFGPSLPLSLASGSSSGTGFACLRLKADRLVCSLNGFLPSSAEPVLGSLHLPQTVLFMALCARSCCRAEGTEQAAIFHKGGSVRQSNCNWFRARAP